MGAERGQIALGRSRPQRELWLPGVVRSVRRCQCASGFFGWLLPRSELRTQPSPGRFKAKLFGRANYSIGLSPSTRASPGSSTSRES